jgi:hypothetical protein
MVDSRMKKEVGTFPPSCKLNWLIP